MLFEEEKPFSQTIKQMLRDSNIEKEHNPLNIPINLNKEQTSFIFEKSIKDNQIKNNVITAIGISIYIAIASSIAFLSVVKDENPDIIITKNSPYINDLNIVSQANNVITLDEIEVIAPRMSDTELQLMLAEEEKVEAQKAAIDTQLENQMADIDKRMNILKSNLDEMDSQLKKGFNQAK